MYSVPYCGWLEDGGSLPIETEVTRCPSIHECFCPVTEIISVNMLMPRFYPSQITSPNGWPVVWCGGRRPMFLILLHPENNLFYKSPFAESALELTFSVLAMWEKAERIYICCSVLPRLSVVYVTDRLISHNLILVGQCHPKPSPHYQRRLIPVAMPCM